MTNEIFIFLDSLIAQKKNVVLYIVAIFKKNILFPTLQKVGRFAIVCGKQKEDLSPGINFNFRFNK